ncbi:MAG: nucleotidyl transferase AbiEii/AbiGii toxin family protein [Patescibacteria group bacterium]
MHKEILTKEQLELLPLLKMFSKDFGLVGGTAIALHIGHRRSIDFDLFTNRVFKNQNILNKILKISKINRIIVNKLDELTLIIKGVKFTFFYFPYIITYNKKVDNFINMPDLLTLSAMKAFALGMRAKWKDYVDLYFIIKDYFHNNEITKRGKKIFNNEFNEKIFRGQLAYFKDIDYQEEIEYLKGFEVSDEIIKKKLIEFSLK